MEDKSKKGLLYCLSFLEEIDMSKSNKMQHGGLVKQRKGGTYCSAESERESVIRKKRLFLLC